MIGLKLIRLLLPPFHPLKYKYINWYYGSDKLYSINELLESRHQKAHLTF